jgi:hypothetical protein
MFAIPAEHRLEEFFQSNRHFQRIAENHDLGENRRRVGRIFIRFITFSNSSVLYELRG